MPRAHPRVVAARGAAKATHGPSPAARPSVRGRPLSLRDAMRRRLGAIARDAKRASKRDETDARTATAATRARLATAATRARETSETLAAALAGRGSAGWGRDPHLSMFVETAAGRGLDVREVREVRLAWHGLRNVSVLRVQRAGKG